MLKNKWAIISLLFLVWALVASLLAGYYLYQYTDINNKLEHTNGILIKVNIGVDYGNGTRTYYNSSNALTGQKLLDVTRQVTEVTIGSSSLGAYVTGINGKTASADYGWTFWPWNSQTTSWDYAPVGADQFAVANGETYVWYYQNAFDPPP